MKISQLIWSAMVGVMLMAAILGGGLLWVEGKAWRDGSRGEILTQAFATALRIADALIAERNATREFLSNTPPTPMLTIALREARALSDVDADRLRHQLHAADLINDDTTVILAKALGRLSTLRLKVDHVASASPGERAKLYAEAYPDITEVLGGIRPIAVPIEMALIDAAGSAVGFHQLAQLAVEARISAGARSGRLGDAMLAGRAPTPEETAFMERMAARVEAFYDRIQAATRQLGSPEPIVHAIEAMNAEYFTVGKGIFNRHQASINAGAPYPASASVFFEEIGQPLLSIQLIRDAALDEAVRRTRINREWAKFAFISTALLVAASAAGAVGFCLMLRRRVIRPIGQLTATMERMADPNWAANELAADDRPGAGIAAVDQRDEVGLMAGAVAVFREGLLNSETLRRQQQAIRLFLDAVLEHVPTPIFVKGASDLTFLYVNQAAEAFAGVSRNGLWGHDESAVFLPETLASTEAGDAAALAATAALVEHDVQLETIHNGDRRADMTRVVIPGSDILPRLLLTLINDVTEQRRTEARAAHLARYDSLTDLPNRATFMERLSEAVAESRREGTLVAVLSLDLDRFSEVNDVLGHASGDTVLRLVAGRLGDYIHECDLVARIGGDEFAVILCNLRQKQDAEILAHCLIRAIAQAFQVKDHPVFVGVSIGLAVSEPGLVAGDLFQRSALALNEAKEAGRGSLRWFQPSMDVRQHTRQTMQHELGAAIGTSQLFLHYQPQVKIDGGTIIGAEALMRWDNPNQGVILPSVFIALAEETDLIGRLGAWLLAEACSEAARWPAHLTVAVNLSPKQIRLPGFIESVGRALMTSGLDPGRLELEVTEGILLQDTEGTLAIFGQLRAMGVKLSLDDFGTGYSSLGYLERFRFDKIKIDRSFVTDLLHRPDAVAIVRAVLGLCTALGMEVVAEGAETESEVSALRALGCRIAQGFHFWKPMDAPSMRRLAWRTGTAQADMVAE